MLIPSTITARRIRRYTSTWYIHPTTHKHDFEPMDGRGRYIFQPPQCQAVNPSRWSTLAPPFTGRPPPFGGTTGQVHDRIVEKMREVLYEKQIPTYLDTNAARLLEGARSEFLRLNLDKRSICSLGEKSALVATWAGTVKTTTLALWLRNVGYTAVVHHGFLEVEKKSTDLSVESALRDIAEITPDLSRISRSGLERCMSEKFHRYLSSDLLYEDVVTSVVDLAAMPQLAESIIGANCSS